MKTLVSLIVLMFGVSVFAGNNSSPQCTNFSGFWKGKCDSNIDEGIDKTFMAIEQAADCSGLHYGPHPQIFGTENVTSWAGGAVVRTDNINWNDPNNRQYLQGTVVIERVGGPTINSTLMVTKGDRKTMYFDFSGTLEFGNGTVVPFEQSCTYRKVGRVRGDF